MALSIYQTASPSTNFSEDGTFANPIQQAFDGVTGGVIETKYYVRNNDDSFFYTVILVQPIVVSGTDIVTGPDDGYNWKLIVGDTQPLQAQWDLVTAGSSISLADIGSAGNGDTTTFLPFWIRIEVPIGAPVTSFEGIQLQTTSTENTI